MILLQGRWACNCIELLDWDPWIVGLLNRWINPHNFQPPKLPFRIPTNWPRIFLHPRTLKPEKRLPGWQAKLTPLSPHGTRRCPAVTQDFVCLRLYSALTQGSPRILKMTRGQYFFKLSEGPYRKKNPRQICEVSTDMWRPSVSVRCMGDIL